MGFSALILVPQWFVVAMWVSLFALCGALVIMYRKLEDAEAENRFLSRENDDLHCAINSEGESWRNGSCADQFDPD